MLHLTLVGVSDDGGRLQLVSDRGAEFSLAIDNRLRAALSGDHARLGQLEIQMESALRPRDIQARIRAGETPEAVAQAASTTLEKILPYAGPVLAERAHVAQRAQESSVRRRNSESGARSLGQAIDVHLRSLNVDPDQVEWDAWRREDGRWQLMARFENPVRRGTATYAFDVRDNFVLPENEEARWLIGDGKPSEKTPRDDLQRARARRSGAAGTQEELFDSEPDALGTDAIEMVTGTAESAEESAADASAQQGPRTPTGSPIGSAPDSPETTDAPAGTEVRADDDTEDLTAAAARLRSLPDVPAKPAARKPAKGRKPVPADQPDAVPSPAATTEPGAGDGTPEDESGAQQEETAPAPARRPARKSRGRASVPSWDEIMFGGGSGDSKD